MDGDDKTHFDFNFWPSVSDLMLGVVLIFVVVMYVNAAKTRGSVDPTSLRKAQDGVLNALSMEYDTSGVVGSNGERTSYFFKKSRKISAKDASSDSADIQVKSTLERQDISFSEGVLFKKNKYDLDEDGKEVLLSIGPVLKEQANKHRIKEIQILGHADSDPIAGGRTNLELAADRAMAVYDFLRRDVEVDPVKCLMSATSFGEFKPVGRAVGDTTFTEQKLAEKNADEAKKTRNRRIEIRLLYTVEDTVRADN
jgi:flagellar motor protein MotB